MVRDADRQIMGGVVRLILKVPQLLLPTFFKDRDGRIYKIIATDTWITSHDIYATYCFLPLFIQPSSYPLC